VITAIGEVLEYLLSLGAFGKLLGEVLGEILWLIMLGASLRFSLGREGARAWRRTGTSSSLVPTVISCFLVSPGYGFFIAYFCGLNVPAITTITAIHTELKAQHDPIASAKGCPHALPRLTSDVCHFLTGPVKAT
jgi:hypothetical protein